MGGVLVSETAEVKQLLMDASELGSRLFRNNTGMGWSPAGSGSNIVVIRNQSRIIKCTPGDVVVRQARPLHAGLCKGSSDLIGWSPLTITPDMVGKTIAVFTGAEVKVGRGRATKEQKSFNQAVCNHGGRAGIVRSKDDLVVLLRSPIV